MQTSILGERVLLLRRRHDLTQEKLGQAVGLAANTIARLERGEVQELRSNALCRLADVLGVSMDYLVGRDNGET